MSINAMINEIVMINEIEDMILEEYPHISNDLLEKIESILENPFNSIDSILDITGERFEYLILLAKYELLDESEENEFELY